MALIGKDSLFMLNNFRHKLRFQFMQWNSIQYLKRSGVVFKDIASVRMNGKCLIAIDKTADVYIGSRFIVNSGGVSSIDSLPYSKIIVSAGSVFKVGDDSGMSNTVIQCHEKIQIGNHVNIGAGCLIMDTDFHSTDWRDRKDRKDRKTDTSKAKHAPVIIEDCVFIGSRCIVLFARGVISAMEQPLQLGL